MEDKRKLLNYFYEANVTSVVKLNKAKMKIKDQHTYDY